MCVIAEVPNFLSDAECQFLIDLAKRQKLEESKAIGGLQKTEDFKKRESKSLGTGHYL